MSGVENLSLWSDNLNSRFSVAQMAGLRKATSVTGVNGITGSIDTIIRLLLTSRMGGINAVHCIWK